MFSCLFAYFQTTRNTRNFFQKRYFWTSGVVKNVFWCICAYFQTTRNFFSKKDNFERLEWLKTCFDAFAHTSRLPETFFDCLAWFKTCFNALSNTSRPQESCPYKRYVLTSGVVKNVFSCICAYFQSTRNFFSKKIFFTVWSGKGRVSMHLWIHLDHQKHFFKKDIFDRLAWLKTCFDAFAHTSRPPETFLRKIYFKKRYFKTTGCAYFQTTRIISSKKIFFKRLKWLNIFARLGKVSLKFNVFKA